MVTKKTVMRFIFPLAIALMGGCDKNNGATDNTLPKFSIDDVNAVEGNTGINTVVFHLKLDRAGSKPVTVHYSTIAGSARAGTDFTEANGDLTFQPGETQKSVSVEIKTDDIKESDEDFSLVLTGLTNAEPVKLTGTATITNDDTRVPIASTGYDAPTSYASYTLVWADEFNNGTLDNTAWTNQNGDGCPDNCGWGNNEQEYYTDRPDNIFFQDGNLVIEAKKESMGGKPYTSSKILTRGKKSFKFGRIDIRAQLPKGKGIWPAFWLLPQNNVFGGWPSSGEIDIMEMIGHLPANTYGTVHYGPGPGSIHLGGSYTLPSGIFNDKFHVFSLEWKQDQVKWYVDGALYYTVNKADIGNNNWPFNEEFFLIFNMAVGGNWPGNPDATTDFPQWLVVDYVRWYQ
jgi:beta-glucanase (GH16 family)